MLIDITTSIRFLYSAIRLQCNEATIKNIMVKFVESYIGEDRLTPREAHDILEQYGIHECQACLENQPNQQAHMSPDGCLYVENGC
jgi:hypothetical protein